MDSLVLSVIEYLACGIAA